MNSAPVVILDTNIVLDLFLFDDPRTALLRQSLTEKQIHWWATPHMRSELERVLHYEHLTQKQAFYGKSAAAILAEFDRHAQLIAEPISKAPYTCKDSDDQVFIDLACHAARKCAPNGSKRSKDDSDPSSPSRSNVSPQPPIVYLISKDKAVLCMKKRLEKLTIFVSVTFFA